MYFSASDGSGVVGADPEADHKQREDSMGLIGAVGLMGDEDPALEPGRSEEGEAREVDQRKAREQQIGVRHFRVAAERLQPGVRFRRGGCRFAFGVIFGLELPAERKNSLVLHAGLLA
jgi:hypothetical protein